jgi:FkbM family methyltransferase
VSGAAAIHLRNALSRRGDEVVGRVPTGSPIVLDLGDWIHQLIYYLGVWESATTHLIRRLARPGWRFIDVGANAGYYSLLARDLGGPGSTIHAFEPNPVLADLLERSARLGGGGEIEVVRRACGEADGVAELFVNPDPVNSGSSTLVRPTGPFTATIPVAVVRLDSHCAEHDLVPDAVKLDVEGAEHEVIAGMEDLLRRRVPRHLVCEVHAADTPPPSVADQLGEFGYEPSAVLPDGRLVPLVGLDEPVVCFRAPVPA